MLTHATWMGKEATDESQVSNKRWKAGSASNSRSHPLLSPIITGKISFLPELIDVAFLGWVM